MSTSSKLILPSCLLLLLLAALCHAHPAGLSPNRGHAHFGHAPQQQQQQSKPRPTQVRLVVDADPRELRDYYMYLRDREQSLQHSANTGGRFDVEQDVEQGEQELRDRRGLQAAQRHQPRDDVEPAEVLHVQPASARSANPAESESESVSGLSADLAPQDRDDFHIRLASLLGAGKRPRVGGVSYGRRR